jgi:hypothetical protein
LIRALIRRTLGLMRRAILLSLLLVACGDDAPTPSDATVPDAAPVDAASPVDAMLVDADGLVDASSPDAGIDGGASDAGPPAACDPVDSPTPNDGLSEAPGEGGCLAGMVPAGGACVDRYEASLVLVDDTGPIGSWSPFHNPGTNRVGAVSIAGAVPQGYISGTQAAAACAESGKRLCTDAEWLLACRGSANRTYPYGATRVDGVCNDARAVHPAIERFGTSASWIWSSLDDACINQLPESLALTGSHTGCVTPEGVFDLMGNVHEWTADPAGTFRGGYYVDTRINGDGCLYATTAHDVSHWDYSTGFRCCAAP